jgi:hypothetical protein
MMAVNVAACGSAEWVSSAGLHRGLKRCTFTMAHYWCHPTARMVHDILIFDRDFLAMGVWNLHSSTLRVSTQSRSYGPAAPYCHRRR